MTTPTEPGDVTEREADWRRWKRGERLEVLAKVRGVTRERMRHQLMRTDEGMDTLALITRAEQAEAERDAAFAAGQEDMRKRVVIEVESNWGCSNTPLAAAIRALPIKHRP